MVERLIAFWTFRCAVLAAPVASGHASICPASSGRAADQSRRARRAAARRPTRSSVRWQGPLGLGKRRQLDREGRHGNCRQWRHHDQAEVSATPAAHRMVGPEPAARARARAAATAASSCRIATSCRCSIRITNTTYFDGQAGSIYKQMPPMVNAMRPPGEWNIYDVVWTAPQFKDDGSLEIAGLYHGASQRRADRTNHFALLGEHAVHEVPTLRQSTAKLPIRLQDHGNPVRFRNIWVREIKPLEGKRDAEPTSTITTAEGHADFTGTAKSGRASQLHEKSVERSKFHARRACSQADRQGRVTIWYLWFDDMKTALEIQRSPLPASSKRRTTRFAGQTIERHSFGDAVQRQCWRHERTAQVARSRFGGPCMGTAPAASTSATSSARIRRMTEFEQIDRRGAGVDSRHERPSCRHCLPATQRERRDPRRRGPAPSAAGTSVAEYQFRAAGVVPSPRLESLFSNGRNRYRSVTRTRSRSTSPIGRARFAYEPRNMRSPTSEKTFGWPHRQAVVSLEIASLDRISTLVDEINAA